MGSQGFCGLSCLQTAFSARRRWCCCCCFCCRYRHGEMCVGGFGWHVGVDKRKKRERGGMVGVNGRVVHDD